MLKKRGKEFYQNFIEIAHVIFKELVHCIEKGLTPSSPEVQRMIKKHHVFADQIQDATQKVYKAMAELYQKHPQFRKQLDLFHPKLAEFMSERMMIFADRELH